MKKLSLLGSTGSIGCNVLSIVQKFPRQFTVKALAAGSNVNLLARQIEQFSPDLAVVIDQQRARQLNDLLPAGHGVQILYGQKGYQAAAAHEGVDMTVGAMVGAAGLRPALAAIEAGKPLALANKETLVMAGDYVMARAAEKKVDILPIDSEHSAIFQCLQGQRRQDLERILLTASGGPFLNRPREEFAGITPGEALQHPNWKMGPKITIDSATLMNKGLEVLEAKCLFGVSHEKIQVVIHPQSVVHSMVAYQDGSVMAQLGVPDMKTAIAYALSYPRRLPLEQPLPRFDDDLALTFKAPDFEKFSCLKLAMGACETGGTLPAVLNAANEVAVHAFLDKGIGFLDIARIIAAAMDSHAVVHRPDLADILEADQWARRRAQEEIKRLQS
jgi:1-deoxy-D-xylulose-5-phosphate reductoisomerase